MTYMISELTTVFQNKLIKYLIFRFTDRSIFKPVKSNASVYDGGRFWLYSRRSTNEGSYGEYRKIRQSYFSLTGS